MISSDDIIALCGLTEDQVAAIAEHEHMPDMTAAALADYLMHRPGGADRVRQMIIDDIKAALDTHHIGHAVNLMEALKRFCTEHKCELS
ncbi:MAG: hypothetical protein AAFX39_05760 [Pseudomonadota bacterium]